MQNRQIRELYERWRFNADLMTCNACGYSVIATRMHETAHHAAGCENAGEENPWLQLAEMLQAIKVGDGDTSTKPHGECSTEIHRLEAEVLSFRQALEHEKTIGARRNFVLGAKWWQSHKNGATAFASECDEMDREAVKRYGLPQRFDDGMTPEDDRRFLEGMNELTHNAEVSGAGTASAGLPGWQANGGVE